MIMLNPSSRPRLSAALSNHQHEQRPSKYVRGKQSLFCHEIREEEENLVCQKLLPGTWAQCSDPAVAHLTLI
jgi:hypothetical protein